MKVLIHVQHLLGTGHQRRAGAIAVALARSGAEVVYVTGGMPDPGHQAGLSSFSNIKLVQLAPARAGDLRYSHLVDRFGRPASDEWRNARKAHLLSVFRDERPDALVVETFPFGRKLLEFELLPLMDAAVAARPRPLLVCSVRDIIEPRDNMDRYRRMLDQAMRYIDCVLVHSDPAIVPLGASFPFARDLDQRLWYTGFVTSARSRTKVVLSEGRGEVVVSAGGGAVGRCLYRTAMGARQLLGQAYGPGRNLPGRHLMSRTTWRILAGVPKPARLAASLTSPVSIMARGFTPPRANAGSLAGASSHGIVIEPNREGLPLSVGSSEGVGLPGRLQHIARRASGWLPIRSRNPMRPRVSRNRVYGLVCFNLWAWCESSRQRTLARARWRGKWPSPPAANRLHQFGPSSTAPNTRPTSSEPKSRPGGTNEQLETSGLGPPAPRVGAMVNCRPTPNVVVAR